MSESKIRWQIAKFCRKMYELGWVAATDGNVSVRLECGDILTTPSGVCKGDIIPETLIHVTATGELVPSTAHPAARPSSELKMHLRCYACRPDVTAVIHAHPPCATAFAIVGKPLDDLSLMEAVLTIGNVPIAPYATPSTEQVGDCIEPFLQNHDVLLLQNHGTLSVGKDLISAFRKTEILEHSAKTLINAYSIGKPIPISAENVQKLCALREQHRITVGAP